MNQEFLDYLDQNDFKFISVKNALTHFYEEKKFKEIQKIINFSKDLHPPIKMKDLLKIDVDDLEFKTECGVKFYRHFLESDFYLKSKSEDSKNSSPLNIQLNVLDYYNWLKSEKSVIAKIISNNIDAVINEIEETIDRIPILKSILIKENKNSKKESKTIKTHKNSSLKEEVQKTTKEILSRYPNLKATQISKRDEIFKCLAPNVNIEKSREWKGEEFQKKVGVQQRRIIDWISEEINK